MPRSSWDRDPYWFTDPVSGQRSTVKQYDEIARNFIVANYNSLGAVDNDDGSSYYYVSLRALARARAREPQGAHTRSLTRAASPRLAAPSLPPPLRPTTTSSATEGAASRTISKVPRAQRRHLRACVRRLTRTHRRPPPLPLLRPLDPQVWTGNAVMFIDQYCIHNGYGGNMDPVLPGHEQQLTGNLCVINHDQDYGLPTCTVPLRHLIMRTISRRRAGGCARSTSSS